MAKRSPILGYNHNVRYRGVVFHVQTEDSGLLSPHLFTHLFHGGVIISTRKLVYDGGSAEEAIKALMQAQHKAVMKDLRRGRFDDKIDQYLAGTPGLLPRGVAEAGEAGEAADLARSSAPDIPIPKEDSAAPAKPRTKTAERTSPTKQVRNALGAPPPPGDDLDPPTITDDSAAIASGAMHATVKTLTPFSVDSSPEIMIQVGDDGQRIGPIDDGARSDGIPSPVGAGATIRTDGSAPPPPERRSGSAVDAAALPPARPITRPPASKPAMATPMVMARPLHTDEPRRRGDSDVVEVYAPPPPSADPPPGAMAERPGRYSQHRRPTQPPPREVANERSGPTAIPAGLARPGARSAPPAAAPAGRAARQTATPIDAEPPELLRYEQPRAIEHRQPEPPRQPPPGRPVPPARGPDPATSRTNTGSSGGVVMTRPAVIVGAPSKPAAPPRVRKAREEEGRGFGQGLISEKSLDEVILAYLSEDSEDK